ncbi:MAG: glycine/sarcosine/betaine reductase component B subunit [Syntrophus sp. (in: bacteria)]|nr:glycine/sarcosine/betaine reductase component B subunit [Syntrophus sp. (in: bacteria)]
MLLELGIIPVEEIDWGRKTAIDGKALQIHREKLIEETRGNDSRIASVRADLARPGERVRILPVKDVIEPRISTRKP